MDQPGDGRSTPSIERGTRQSALIVNAQARHGASAFRQAWSELERQGVHVGTARLIFDPARIPDAVRIAIDQGADVVIIGAGDGTISSVAGQLANTAATLGIIPLGTGNDFARALGIPPDIAGACHVIAEGHAAAVDLGRFDSGYFVNEASVGFSGWVVGRVPIALKRYLGLTAYGIVSLWEIARFRPFHATIRANSLALDLTTFVVVIANGPYAAGGYVLAPGASVVDHTLHVFAPTCTSLGARLRFGLALQRARHLALPGVCSFRATRVRIETEPVQKVEADGEVTQVTPVDARVLPGALRVLVPTTFSC